jgi:uncharacterized protein (TIGR01777 family)
MTPVFALLLVQALLGALDNLWHHEITERLPAKRSAAGELTLHATRELIYGCLFFQLAWLELKGTWAMLMASLLALEIVITLSDFVLEDRTRQLPPFERVLHTLLAINFGTVLAAFAPVLLHWWSQSTEITPVSYGRTSWILSACALGALTWSVRNAIAVLRLRRPPEWVRNPIPTRPTIGSRTVLVSGGTGFIGGHLIRRLLARGDRIIVLTRDADRALDRFGPHVQIITRLDELDEHTCIDAVVNLAGAPILGFPWTQARRRKLIGTRVETTRSLVELCGRLVRPPRVFISGSAIGYYGVRGDDPLDEKGDSQSVFQSRLCQEWESAADAAEDLVSRVVKMRIGLVLGRDGGAFPRLVPPVRWGFGAILGKGTQWVSWIHIDDLVRLFEFVLDTPTLRGAVNAVSPQAATHAQMQTLVGKVLHRPMVLRIPAFAIRAVMGEMAQLLVDGQRVIPARVTAAGFLFKHPNLGEALADLLADPENLPRGTSADVYYNGECPVCRGQMEQYAALCAASRPDLHFVDSNRLPSELTACGLRREHLERRIYLRDSAGRILSGMPAIVALWARMPGYQWHSRVFSLPLVRQASVAIYDHVVAPSLAFWATRRAQRALGEPHATRRELV